MSKMPTHGRVTHADGTPTSPWLNFFNDLATAVQVSEAEDLDELNAVLDEQESELAGLQEVFDDVDYIYNKLIFANVVTCKAYRVTLEAGVAKTITHNFLNERPENVIRQNQAAVYDDDGNGSAFHGKWHYHFLGHRTTDYATSFGASTLSVPADETVLINFFMDWSGPSDSGDDVVRGDNDFTITKDGGASWTGDHILAFFLPWFRGYDAD